MLYFLLFLGGAFSVNQVRMFYLACPLSFFVFFQVVNVKLLNLAEKTSTSHINMMELR